MFTEFRLFIQTNGYIYINLQLLAYVNNFSIWIYGLCCFFGTIKLIRLYLFIRTVQLAGEQLFSFALMFSIVFFAFIFFFIHNYGHLQVSIKLAECYSKWH